MLSVQVRGYVEFVTNHIFIQFILFPLKFRMRYLKKVITETIRCRRLSNCFQQWAFSFLTSLYDVDQGVQSELADFGGGVSDWPVVQLRRGFEE